MKLGIVGPQASKWTEKQKIECQATIWAILWGQCAMPHIMEGDRRVKLELVEWEKDI